MAGCLLLLVFSAGSVGLGAIANEIGGPAALATAMAVHFGVFVFVALGVGED